MTADTSFRRQTTRRAIFKNSNDDYIIQYLSILALKSMTNNSILGLSILPPTILLKSKKQTHHVKHMP